MTTCEHERSLKRDDRCCVDCGLQLRRWYLHEWLFWEFLTPLCRLWHLDWWFVRCSLGFHNAKAGEGCGMCGRVVPRHD